MKKWDPEIWKPETEGFTTMIIPPGSTQREWFTLRGAVIAIEFEKKRNADAHEQLRRQGRSGANDKNLRK